MHDHRSSSSTQRKYKIKNVVYLLLFVYLFERFPEKGKCHSHSLPDKAQYPELRCHPCPLARPTRKFQLLVLMTVIIQFTQSNFRVVPPCLNSQKIALQALKNTVPNTLYMEAARSFSVKSIMHSPSRALLVTYICILIMQTEGYFRQQKEQILSSPSIVTE